MTNTDVTDVARRFIQAWNAGQQDIVDELADPDFTADYTHFPEPFEDPEAFKQMLAQTHRYFPNLSIEVHDVVANGNRVIVHWVYRGTFQEGEMFGVQAAGQSVEVEGMTKYRIEEGRVQRERGIVDNFGLMMQLGAEPHPPDA
jgi:steroid delta-isomerase-like uncharacterized protein